MPTRWYRLRNCTEVSLTPCKISVNSREEISSLPPWGRSKVPTSSRLMYNAYPSPSHCKRRTWLPRLPINTKTSPDRVSRCKPFRTRPAPGISMFNSVKPTATIEGYSNFLAQYLKVAYLMDSCSQKVMTGRLLSFRRWYKAR